MSLLIPSGHRKREAIELLRQNIRMFILSGAPGVEPTTEAYLAWMLGNDGDIDVQARLNINRRCIQFDFKVTSVPKKKG